MTKLSDNKLKKDIQKEILAIIDETIENELVAMGGFYTATEIAGEVILTIQQEKKSEIIVDLIEKLKNKRKQLQIDYDIVSVLGNESGYEATDVLQNLADERGIFFSPEHFEAELNGIESYQYGINYALDLLGVSYE